MPKNNNNNIRPITWVALSLMLAAAVGCCIERIHAKKDGLELTVEGIEVYSLTNGTNQVTSSNEIHTIDKQ